MAEMIVVCMVLVFIFGLGIVIKDVLQHAQKPRLTKGSSGRSVNRNWSWGLVPVVLLKEMIPEITTIEQRRC